MASWPQKQLKAPLGRFHPIHNPIPNTNLASPKPISRLWENATAPKTKQKLWPLKKAVDQPNYLGQANFRVNNEPYQTSHNHKTINQLIGNYFVAQVVNRNHQQQTSNGRIPDKNERTQMDSRHQNIYRHIGNKTNITAVSISTAIYCQDILLLQPDSVTFDAKLKTGINLASQLFGTRQNERASFRLLPVL